MKFLLSEHSHERLKPLIEKPNLFEAFIVTVTNL